jgi:hypothetical protein
MTTAVWVIMTLVIGVIALLSILSNLVTRTPRALRELAEEFPPLDPQPGATRGGALGVIALGDSRGSEIDWRWTIDEDCLHLTHSKGISGGGVSASIPWAAMRLRNTKAGHMGEFAALSVTERFTIVLPAAVIENEMPYLRENSGAASAPESSEVFIDAPPKGIPPPRQA